MKVGVPAEVKDGEFRVAVTPANTRGGAVTCAPVAQAHGLARTPVAEPLR